MKILAIESSSLVASVAVTEDGVTVAEYTVNFKKTHSQTLLPMIDQIAAMTDTSDQPIARVNAGVSGKPEYRILGRPVNFVSSEYMSDFSSTVSADTVVAFMFRMEDYILNTNLNVTVKRYEDHETDDQVTKAIMMADGKVVDNNSLVEVIQKKL